MLLTSTTAIIARIVLAHEVHDLATRLLDTGHVVVRVAAIPRVAVVSGGLMMVTRLFVTHKLIIV